MKSILPTPFEFKLDRILGFSDLLLTVETGVNTGTVQPVTLSRDCSTVSVLTSVPLYYTNY